MNTIEDRIRAAARAAADTVTPDDVPPLRLPARRAWRSWSFGSAWTRRLAPAAAAVAVAVVVIAALTVTRAMHNSAPVPSPPATGTISSLVASGQVPRYYVAINAGGDAVVRATATGRTLATIRPSAPASMIVAVTAAANDRTFVLDEQQYAVPETSARQAIQTRNFYSFRLNSAGQPGAPNLILTLPAGQKVTGIALSPDGSMFALAVDRSQDNLGINVYGVTSHDTFRSWTATAGTIGYGTDDAKSLSWTKDGSTLAFAWDGNGVRLLNVKASSDNLLTASRAAAFGGTGQGWACDYNLLLTPDGKTLVCGARVRSPESVSNDQIGYPEFAAATGKLVRVLDRSLSGPAGPFLTWTNASGSVLITGIQAPSGRTTFGVVTGNRFVPLPWSADLSVLSPAW
jgi:WD40-like Beta Propeller Repeat